MKAIVRAYVYGIEAPIFTEVLEDSEAITHEEFQQLIAKHIEAVAGRDHVIEVEFPAQGDKPATFHRIGTDPRLMKVPIPLRMAGNDERDRLTAILRRARLAQKAPWN